MGKRERPLWKKDRYEVVMGSAFSAIKSICVRYLNALQFRADGYDNFMIIASSLLEFCRIRTNGSIGHLRMHRLNITEQVQSPTLTPYNRLSRRNSWLTIRSTAAAASTAYCWRSNSQVVISTLHQREREFQLCKFSDFDAGEEGLKWLRRARKLTDES